MNIAGWIRQRRMQFGTGGSVVRIGHCEVDADDPYEYRSTDWPRWDTHSSRGRRRRSRGAIIGTLMGLFFVVSTVVETWQSDTAIVSKVAITASLLVYVAHYSWISAVGLVWDKRKRIVAVISSYVLGVLPSILSGNPENLTFLTFAVVVAVMLLPLRLSRIVAAATMTLQILGMWLVNGHVNWGLVWVMFSVGWGLSAFFALIHTINALRYARSEIAELAVASERERLARDLHDILGHSLTTITVKAGLARRMLESSAIERAEHEITDVESLGRQALADVRATVSNYRTASLPAELAGARMSLQAAQITPQLPTAVDNVATQLQETFGYVVREAVTNVIRHSGASRCEIRLGQRWIEIIDNGSGATQPTAGNGLTGLRERMDAIGGTLVADADHRGFRVRAAVEIEEDA